MFDDAKKFNASALEEYESLDHDEKLKWFCAVVQKIVQAEVDSESTFRHTLYGHFGFKESSYVPANIAGYMSIHNLIFSGKDMEELESFNSLEVNTGNETHRFDRSVNGLGPSAIYKTKETDTLVINL